MAELGAEVAADYDGLEPLFVAPLKASLIFLADLSRATPILHHLDFVELAPYDASAQRPQPAGIRLLKDLDARIDGRDVLIVEDIVDSGLTLNYLLRNLRARSPRSLEVCALLVKPGRRKIELPIRYVGFEIPNRFVVGYGLDLDQRYRNLSYVAALDEEPGAGDGLQAVRDGAAGGPGYNAA